MSKPTIELKYLGFIDKKFKYKATINGHEFDYWTGSGWAVAGSKKPEDGNYVALSREEKDLWLDIQNLRTRNTLIDKHGFRGFKVFRQVPSDNDVLECFKNDVECGQMSFYDFCDNFGYDKDSINALKVHMACMETAQKLRGVTFPTNEE